jgi:ATP-dependent helicase HrpA
LSLPQQAKYVAKRMTDDRELVLLSRGLPLDGSIADALTRRAFRECFLPSEAPLPRDAQGFATLLELHRARLADIADALVASVVATLKEWRTIRTSMERLGSQAFAAALREVNAQLEELLPPDFVASVPRPWLDYLPRYLKAIVKRLDRLPANAQRDAELASKVKPFTTALAALLAQAPGPTVPDEVVLLRWMIEEYRVSLFAQELKTPVKVSDKRLAELLSAARTAVRG